MEWSELARERGPSAIYTFLTDSAIHAYQKNFETLVAEYSGKESTGETLLGNEMRIANAMVSLGHRDEAEQLFRKILNVMGSGLTDFTQDGQADAAAQLINILDPAHPDRQLLLGSLRVFVERALQVRPFDSDTHYLQAYLATFEGDREAAINALRNAYDRGMRGRWWLAQDPVFQRWHSDPIFMELMLEMKQEATRMRVLLEAAP